MAGKRFCVKAAAWLAALAVVAGVDRAPAAGLMNMPTSLRQCLGGGVGPGYHAPMVLGLPGRTPIAAQRIHYQWHSPRPCRHCGMGSAMSVVDVYPAAAAASPGPDRAPPQAYPNPPSYAEPAAADAYYRANPPKLFTEGPAPLPTPEPIEAP